MKKLANFVILMATLTIALALTGCSGPAGGGASIGQNNSSSSSGSSVPITSLSDRIYKGTMTYTTTYNSSRDEYAKLCFISNSAWSITRYQDPNYTTLWTSNSDCGTYTISGNSISLHYDNKNGQNVSNQDWNLTGSTSDNWNTIVFSNGTVTKQ